MRRLYSMIDVLNPLTVETRLGAPLTEAAPDPIV